MYLRSALVMLLSPFFLVLFILPSIATAQFQFFNNFFEGQHQQQPQEKQNVASDSSWYQQVVENARCTHYLCPNTLACVHFPHHCPCAFPAVEDKVELAEGSAICVSKGGYKAGEAARKIELARKGVL